MTTAVTIVARAVPIPLNAYSMPVVVLSSAVRVLCRASLMMPVHCVCARASRRVHVYIKAGLFERARSFLFSVVPDSGLSLRLLVSTVPRVAKYCSARIREHLVVGSGF